MNISVLSSMFQQKNDLYNREVIEIQTDKIIPNRFQPRKDFDLSELMSLAKSISQLGVIQPLTVRKTEDIYELICGERRLRAAKIAGLKTVPCIISNISDSQSAMIALIENIQRQDLNFFEQAEGIKMLIEIYGITQQEAAIKLSLSQPAVANKLRLLKLSGNHREIIIKNNLSERHARALLRLKEERRSEVLNIICEKSLTAEETEKYISQLFKNDKIKESYMKRSAAVGDVRLFFNTVEKALNIMRLAGVDAKSEKKQEDGFIEYTIKIPKSNHTK